MPYSGAVRLTHTTGDITSTGVTTVLAANPSRRYAYFACASTAHVIWLGVSTATVAAGKGIALTPAPTSASVGTVYEMSVPKGNLYTGAVTAIASATTTVGIVITEGI